MAEIASFVHKFRANPAPANVTNPGTTIKVQKRNRPVVSCLSCRSRKSKCDREHPTCGTCKGNGTTCVYRSNAKDGAKSSAQDRLAQLENLVLQLMNDKDNNNSDRHSPRDKVLTPPTEGSGSAASSPEDDDCVAANQGAFRNGIHGPSYVGPTNWEAVLDTINGLRSELAFTDEFYADRSRNDKTRESLFTTPCPMNLSFVLQVLPDRGKVNQLLSAYFNAKILCMPIIHIGAFHRMYEKFWVDPSSVPVLWISQMFSMLSIGTLIYETAERSEPLEVNAVPPRNQLLRAAAQCLVFANWERPQRHVVEALFFYTMSKMIAGVNPACDSDEVWVLYGSLIRQAYRLGYHREPSQIPGISVFDAEMRRRVWHIIRQFDLVGCLQFGLPCNIQDDATADVLKPRNLHDSDFDENSTELPPSRSTSDVTSMVYYIAKGALMDQLKELLRRQLTKKSLSYDEDVMQLDTSMRTTYAALPDVLRVKPISQSYAIPPWLILNRMKVDLLYHKSLCVLHRHHLDANPIHQYSVDTCVNASMQILRHQQTIHSEALLGGQLMGNRYLVTSMHFPDFFLGAVVLGFLLCNFDSSRLGGDENVAEMKSLLNSALVITNNLQGSFREAVKFSAAIKIILSRLEGPQLSDMHFNFQSFAGPSFASGPASSPGLSTFTSDTGLQEFEGFLNNVDGINWSLIDAGLTIPINPVELEINWNEVDLNTDWMDSV